MSPKKYKIRLVMDLETQMRVFDVLSLLEASLEYLSGSSDGPVQEIRINVKRLSITRDPDVTF